MVRKDVIAPELGGTQILIRTEIFERGSWKEEYSQSSLRLNYTLPGNTDFAMRSNWS